MPESKLTWRKITHHKEDDGTRVTNEYQAVDPDGKVVGYVIKSWSKWYPWHYGITGGRSGDTSTLANGKAVIEYAYANPKIGE